MTVLQDELLRELNRAHGPALHRYVSRLTGDHAFAHDIVQEALIKAWKQPNILEQSDRAIQAWLFTVAKNLVIDDRRSARFRREESAESLPDFGASDETESLLTAWILSDALLALTPPHRSAIINCYYLGQPMTEIARDEGVPVGTIKSRLHYALRALRLSLQEKGEIL